MEQGKALLEKYVDCQVTLSPMGGLEAGKAHWVDTAIHPDLRSAALQVLREEKRRAPYIAVVHMPGEDIQLSYEEFESVVWLIEAEQAVASGQVT